MGIEVLIDKAILDGFIRRAKYNHPNEHMEIMFGTETVNQYRISAFKRIPYTATGNSVDYDDKDLASAKKWGTSKGYTFLGTLHTHPHSVNDASPSEADHLDGHVNGERIMGILHLWKGKDDRFQTDLKFWIPQAPIIITIK